ncbi:hypothetical protein EON78_00075 [bacterium]|nr:MAG: hypothetical protein EON78_00075 [bacterium]
MDIITDLIEYSYLRLSVWETLSSKSNKSKNPHIADNEVLDIMTYSCYQMLYIDIAIMFENDGKHSIRKLFNSLPDSFKSKLLLLKGWERVEDEYEKEIASIIELRNKFLAHRDILKEGFFEKNILLNDAIRKILEVVDAAIREVWFEIEDGAPRLDNTKNNVALITKTFKLN